MGLSFEVGGCALFSRQNNTEKGTLEEDTRKYGPVAE